MVSSANTTNSVKNNASDFFTFFLLTKNCPPIINPSISHYPGFPFRSRKRHHNTRISLATRVTCAKDKCRGNPTPTPYPLTLAPNLTYRNTFITSSGVFALPEHSKDDRGPAQSSGCKPSQSADVDVWASVASCPWRIEHV